MLKKKLAVTILVANILLVNLYAISTRGAEPQIFAPGVISTRDYERDGSFTPDGKTFFFTKRTIWPYFSAICVSTFKNGAWGEPQIAPFSGQYSDAMPFVSPDGKRVYFASRRPVDGVPKRDYDLWYVDEGINGWSAPKRLPAPVNTPGNDVVPIVVRDGSIYYIANDSPHIMYAAKKDDGWAEPVPAGELSTDGSYELSGYVDPDEHFMLVSVLGRDDALKSAEAVYPRADIYIRERRDGKWSPLRHLPPPINSTAEDTTPSVTPDGRYLMFTSERGKFSEHGQILSYNDIETGLNSTGNGLGDIYLADIALLGDEFQSLGAFKGIAEIRNTSSPASAARPGPKTPLTAAARISISDTPQIFGDGIISTPADEFGGAFSPDEKTVYFNKSTPKSYRYTIVESHFVDGNWSKPTVAPFSGQYSDSDAVFSPDGQQIYWTSDRPVNGQIKHDYDIWMVNRKPDGGWSEPVHLPAPINSDASEFFASVTRDGTLYFSSSRDGVETGTIQAYRTKMVNGTWTPPENVRKMIDGADAPAYYDLDVMIAPDESFVILGSLGRPGGFGHFDLYVSWKNGDKWTPAVHLPAPFNTPARDYSPHLSLDGKRLYFSSERGFAQTPFTKPLDYNELVTLFRSTLNGSGNIYEVDLSAIQAFRPKT